MKFDIDHIVLYLENKLSDGEKLVFEEALKNSPELQSEVDLVRLSNELIIGNETIKISNSILEAKNAYLNTQKIKRWSFASLAILSLAGLGFFVFKNSKPEIVSKNTKVESTPQTNNKEENNFKTSDSSKLEKEEVIVSKTEKPKNTFSTIAEKNKVIPSINEETLPVDESKEKTLIEEESKSSPKETSEQKVEVISGTYVKASPCSNTKLAVNLSFTEACFPLSMPQISKINGIGGEKPYNFILTKNSKIIDQNASLENGQYLLKIIDNQGCAKDTSFIIQTKNCDLNYDFNPSMGETWSELEASSNGKISIMHILSQKIVWEENFSKSETIEWDGKTINGDISDGFHIFVIEYEDKRIVKGKITVTQ